MCGSTDSPDPLMFIEAYRLRSLYCLVKPVRGSNVEGIELFDCLLNIKEDPDEAQQSQAEWQSLLDTAIARGVDYPSSATKGSNVHDYNMPSVTDIALTYVAGFIARKIQKWTSCQTCRSSAITNKSGAEREKMIDLLSKGYLLYPSEQLFSLLHALETAIMTTFAENRVCGDSFQIISENILKQELNFIGCVEHKKVLTKQTVKYFSIMRAKIVCKKHNALFDKAKQKEKAYRKLSKLVGNADHVGNSKKKAKTK